ncbi:hypothetical protein OWC48_44950, partial [Bradyrhizobium sp. Arg816]|nr:hypothetical protein [Bradyrhizobium sp. Arg816]
MDPDRINPFSSDWQGRYDPTFAQEQPGEARQAEEAAHPSFEQRLDEARQAVAAPVPAPPAPQNRCPPPLSDEDGSLIEKVMLSLGGPQGLRDATIENYRTALRRLGNDLASKRQSISALTDDALLSHAGQFFSDYHQLFEALRVLRGYREQDATLSRSAWKRKLPPDDEALIEKAAASSKRPATAVRRGTFRLSDEECSFIEEVCRSAKSHGANDATVNSYGAALRRIGHDLARSNQSISVLDHESLVAHAKKVFRDDSRMIPALNLRREHVEFGARRNIRPEDEGLIESAARSSTLPAPIVKRYSGFLRAFSEALSCEGYAITMLDHESRIQRAKQLFRGHRALLPALKMIREFGPEDAVLIGGALDQAVKHPKVTQAQRKSAEERAARLGALSAWLKESGRENIAGRLNRSERESLTLHNDVAAFGRAGGKLYGSDLPHLRNFLKLAEANQSLRLQTREQSTFPAGVGGPLGPPQALPTSPATPSEGAWAFLREQMRAPVSSLTPRALSDTYGGLESFIELNAPTPSELRDDAHFAPVASARTRSDTYGGLESFVDLVAPTPSELRDDAHFAPAHVPAAPSDTYGGLESFIELNAPTPSELRDDAHFAPVASARTRSDTYGG